MGLALGDWDGDGDQDIFITHWIAQENALYDNQPRTAGDPGGSRFLDIADQVGLGQIALDYVGWGTAFFDYDNDGRPDLFVADGGTFQQDADPSRLVAMRNLLFWNAGPSRGFFEAGTGAGKSLGVENVGRGAAIADADGDGDEDVVVNVNGGQARLLRNDGGSAHAWVRIVLRSEPRRRAGGGARGGGPFTTTFATGARVAVTAGGATQVQEIGAQPSYLGQMPPGEAHFGVGSAARVDRLDIAWPDGRKDSFTDLPVRAVLRVLEGNPPAIEAMPAAPTVVDREAVRRFWSAMNAATALRTRGDCAAALSSYRRALAIDPRHEDALYYLGQCAQTRGEDAIAREAFDRLITVNPSSARGHLALGSLLASPAPDRPLALDAAEREFQRAHAINGEETGPVLRLGEIALVRGDEAQARRWLESALRTNPKCVEAAFLLGFLRFRARDLDGARQEVARAVRADAADAPVHGVLSEGDRKPVAPAAAAAGPAPSSAPRAGTLFSAHAEALRGATAAPESLHALYDPVLRSLREFRGRAGMSPRPGR
jgi:tetratricopeptide (TPR) repeat protein